MADQETDPLGGFIALLVLFFKVPDRLPDWLPVHMLPSRPSIKEQSCNKIIKSSPSSVLPLKVDQNVIILIFPYYICALHLTNHAPHSGISRYIGCFYENRELLKAIHYHLKTIINIAPFITPF